MTLADRLGEYVEQAMRAFGVLGCGVAVVRDGEPILVEGFGRRRIDDRRGVGADTLFPLASITKVFTADLAGRLVDEGAIGLDDRVLDHVPEVRFADRWVEHHMTVRDLLSHRLGIGRSMFLEWNSVWTPDQLPALLRYAPIVSPFRVRHSYTNLAFVVAGRALAAAAGMSWADAVDREVCAPLELRRTVNRYGVAIVDGDRSDGHVRRGGRWVALPRIDRTLHGPASVTHSTAADMAGWLDAHARDAAGLLRPTTAATMRSPQVVVPWAGGIATPQTSPPSGRVVGPTSPFNTTAVAWNAFDHRGHAVLRHTGSVDGFTTACAVVPAARLGGVVLVNTEDDGRTAVAVLGRMLDLVLGGAPTDWIGQLSRTVDDDEPVQPSGPTGAADLAGTYHHEAYGLAVVEATDDGLRCRFECLPGVAPRLVVAGPDGRMRLLVDDPVAGTYDTGQEVVLRDRTLSHSPAETFTRVA